MHVTNYRFTLDVNDTASQAMLSVRKGDSARRLIITLSEGGKPYSIAEGCYAVFNAQRSDGAVYFGDCIVSGDVISTELDKAIATAEGRIDCDITLYDADGESLTSPRFSITVYAGVTTGDALEATDEYRMLGELVGDSKKLNDELHGLKDGIAVELEKANDTIDGFNEWYDDTKAELSALTEYTNDRCDELTEACAEKIEECGDVTSETKTACEKLISDTDTACDKLISDTDAACKKLRSDIEVGMAEFTSVGASLTIPADAWSDDTDLLSNQRVQRLAYRISKSGSHKDIIEHNRNNATDAILSEDWQTFEASFVFSPTDNTDQLYLLFYGGKSASFCHPYDIADVKLWLASDAERTNLFPEDIAKLNWWWHYDTSTCPEVNRFSVAYDDDGHKYIHVWRQNAFETADGKVEANLAYLRAGTGVKLTAGETYTLSMRMRTTCGRSYNIVPCPGIRAHSSTVVSPSPEMAVQYNNCGVRAFGERIGELMFVCDKRPDTDLGVNVTATCGEGGMILNCAPAYSGGMLGSVVTGSYVGDGGGVANVTLKVNAEIFIGEDYSYISSCTVTPSVSYSPRKISLPIAPKTLMICYDNKFVVFTQDTVMTYDGKVLRAESSNAQPFKVDTPYSARIVSFSGNSIELCNTVKVSCSYVRDEVDIILEGGGTVSGTVTYDMLCELNNAGVTYNWIAW